MPLHNTQYQHWEGIHLGLWRRRGTIALNGLTACLQIKGMRHVVVMCWIAALGMTATLFLIGQLLVADSIVVQWVGNLNPELQGFARTFTSWLEQHPEVSVRTTQNVLFYYFGTFLLPVSIFALGVVLPVLITRDLASNAIIIYSSKAVSRGDYLLGKFSTALGLLALTWLGPICAAWLLGNLLAPDWRFFLALTRGSFPHAHFRHRQHGHPQPPRVGGLGAFEQGKIRPRGLVYVVDRGRGDRADRGTHQTVAQALEL